MYKTLNNKLRLPKYLKKNIYTIQKKYKTLNILRKLSLNTVCEDAHCINIGECFSKNTATLMILGDKCTRTCNFCSIQTKKANIIYKYEYIQVLNAIKNMNLNYIVITSVNRDDLLDYGANQFIKCINAIKKFFPNVIIEILIPDFNGDLYFIDYILQANPHVLSHNIETVFSLFQKLRPQSNLEHTCILLKKASKKKNILIKSSLMVGLGESNDEVKESIYYLKKNGVNIVIIGQYLRPSLKNWPIQNYIMLNQYHNWIKFGQKIGLQGIFAHFFMRSSYKSKEIYEYVKKYIR